MPELPEVDTMVRQLAARVVGRGIVGVRLTHDDLLDGTTRNSMVRGLKGRIIERVTRRAKHALVHTDTKILAAQPGMTGGLEVLDRPRTGIDAKYDVLTCNLDDGGVLIYRDVRRIGTLRWLTADDWAAYSSRLGPEPLDPDFTPDLFAARLGASRSAIKKVLMDQRYVVGVGNIYANEALFITGIDPSKPADRVPVEKLRALHGAVRDILAQAIANEGTTFRDYRTATGGSGGFQDKLLVYDRAGEPCRNCGTRLAVTHDIDNRQTVFCWRCQG
ncbi:MAG TPA: bifunctional DNA-formamidopyrimidine glycosylase/DNA-(apurinic or apyrimidinic site) lyase [Gemmatimonadales bacterium]|nr:bifunctional DNA-formamidopyrimidine glycosylase/DNA-(apurinic or apyrimidinic site) lyase [Gemmatimonadales bacterium]